MDQSSPQQPASRGVPVERGIISGDNVQFGRMRRRNRLSQSESSGPEEEGVGSYGRSPVLQGLQAEQVWYNRSSYEHAEGNYHRQRTSSGNGPLGSSPRSPNVRSFHPKRNQNQDLSHQSPTMVRSSGTRQDYKGRSRTSSETEAGGKGGRGPAPRKRGFSETENKPKRDKYEPPPPRDRLCVWLFGVLIDFSTFMFLSCRLGLFLLRFIYVLLGTSK